MKRTFVNCYRPVVEFKFFVSAQVLVLSITNSVVMVGDIIANMLIILILIKTKQMANNTCKPFFGLSVSDLMTGLIAQNLQTTLLYEKNCLLMDIYAGIGMFLEHLSMFAIALIGIDHYLGIKHYAKFKIIKATGVVSLLISIEFFLAFLQTFMGLIGPGKEHIIVPVYYTIDGQIISRMVFLQVLTMHASTMLYATAQELLLQGIKIS